MSFLCLLKAKNITQSELANKLNLDKSTVNKWVKGIAKPRASNLQTLSTLLCVTTDELLASLSSDLIPKYIEE